MPEYKKLNDDEILSLCLREVKDSTTFYDTDLSKEREKAIKLYNGKLPKPTRNGTSKYVSYDVFDTVESLKSQLLETFSGNRKVVRFAPEGGITPLQASQATELADYVYNRYNNGFQINSDVIHNGLMSRVGIAKAFWEEKYKVDEEEFERLTEDELDALLVDDNVELAEVTEEDVIDEASGLLVTLYSGVLEVKKDISNAKVKVIPNEDFIISTRATSLDESNVVGDKCLKTKTELLNEGYDPKKVKKITEGNGNNSDTTGGLEKDARHEQRGGSTFTDNTDFQDQVKEFWVYELYVEVDVDGTGVTRLWKVTCTDDVLLDKERVEDKPYFTFCPLPVPHSFYGASFIDRVEPIQNAKTTLIRSTLEHTVITNNPRMQVLNGTVKNQRELLDNRLGGIINVTRLDGLAPVPQSPLNPYVLSVLEMLDGDKEDNTSVSRLSKGMNKDAISKQNSADMMTNLVTLSMQRQKIIARNFAEGFLQPLYVYLIKLVIENAKEPMLVEAAGETLSIDPTSWEEERSAVVEFRIGYQEDEKEAAQYLQMHQMLSADPTMGRLYGEKQKFETIKKALEAKGMHDVAALLANPETLGAPQPNPAEVMQLELQKQEAQIRDRQTRVAELKAELDLMKFKHEQGIDEKRLASDIAAKTDRQDLDEAKFQHKAAMDEFEKSIVAQKAAQGDVNASASVTGTIK